MTASADQLVVAHHYNPRLFATITEVVREHRGDPVILNFGDGNVLFVVLTHYFAEAVFRDFQPRRKTFEAFTASPPMEPRVVDLSDGRVARNIHFFRFKDLTDPSSVELVDANDLAASFGPGFALTKAVFSVRAVDIEPAIGRVPEVLTG